MNVEVSMVIASHLSDVQIEMSIPTEQMKQQANNRLNFVKFLLFKYPNTETVITPKNEWYEFNNPKKEK